MKIRFKTAPMQYFLLPASLSVSHNEISCFNACLKDSVLHFHFSIFVQRMLTNQTSLCACVSTDMLESNNILFSFYLKVLELDHGLVRFLF